MGGENKPFSTFKRQYLENVRTGDSIIRRKCFYNLMYEIRP